MVTSSTARRSGTTATSVGHLPPLTVTTSGIPHAEHVDAPPVVVPDPVWTIPSRGWRDVPWGAGAFLLLVVAVGVAFAPHGQDASAYWVSPSSAFADAP